MHEDAQEEAAICFVKAYARKPIGQPNSNLIPLSQMNKIAQQQQQNGIDWSDAYFYNMMDTPEVEDMNVADSGDDGFYSDGESESEYYSENEGSSEYDSEEESSSNYEDEYDGSSVESNDIDFYDSEEDNEFYDDEDDFDNDLFYDDEEDGFDDQEEDALNFTDEEEDANAYPARRRRRRRGGRGQGHRGHAPPLSYQRPRHGEQQAKRR